ncbi:MAG TPA: 30S ribosomal protein S12 methylthiotransferase RimO [Deltaproteobacteria bacterium]|nr:30S ribosomal protein S12 methylthiotransferase RimO [Deltaproteobacteria bacterium]
MKRFSIISLGCHKNLVDSEYICETMINNGYTLEPDSDTAQCVIVNTCSFLTSAVEESLQTIFEIASTGKKVICAGCLVSRYGRELLKELPEVTIFAGPGTYDGLPLAITGHERFLSPEFTGVVKRSFITTGASAYVKISEGCSNHCNYCLIPKIRGELISKPADSVVEECRVLASKGVKEIILIAQDLGSYCRDAGTRNALSPLVEEISSITGIAWIRLMYVHPASLDAYLAETIRGNPKVCNYIDLPIQHISDKVLRAMGRNGGADAVWEALDLLRSASDDIWIRSTIMVGHPGEDEDAFNELERFIAKGHIDNLGVFTYSAEPGTASCAMPDPLAEEIKNLRKDRIMMLQQEISKKRLESLIGSKIPVLVEEFHPETELLLKGRSFFQAPDVDGCVMINEGSPEFGSFYDIEIIDALEYDLVGRIA